VAYLTAKGGTSGGIAVIAVVLGLVALTGMLAAMAIPAYQDYVVRAKVMEAIASVEPLKTQVEASWSKDQSIPDQLDYAVLENTSAEKYLRSVKLDKENGTLTLVFKNLTSNADGKSIELVPSSRNDAPIRWQCRNIDMSPHFLAASCRQP
jgi:Tfp pilus assembly major pilin PilA